MFSYQNESQLQVRVENLKINKFDEEIDLKQSYEILH